MTINGRRRVSGQVDDSVSSRLISSRDPRSRSSPDDMTLGGSLHKVKVMTHVRFFIAKRLTATRCWGSFSVRPETKKRIGSRRLRIVDADITEWAGCCCFQCPRSRLPSLTNHPAITASNTSSSFNRPTAHNDYSNEGRQITTIFEYNWTDRLIDQYGRLGHPLRSYH